MINESKNSPDSTELSAFRIRFEGLPPAEANRQADELQRLIRQITAGQINTRRLRTSQDTQDLGEVLEFILDITGTRFAVELAKGIRDFVAKKGTRVVIETPDGTIVTATGDAASNIDVDKVIEAIHKQIERVTTTTE